MFFRQPNAPSRVGEPKGKQKIMTVHDMEKAEATYGGFMATLKWAVPVIAVIVFIVVAMIAG
jgi:hypothetical protein